MSTQGKFFVPGDAILRELGRMQVLHSQLDHTLRLAIKRMLGISIDDPGYWNETRGMAADLRKRARELIVDRYSEDEDTADVLNKLLGDAEEATELRNRAMHGVWMNIPEKGPTLQDRDRATRIHVDYEPPTVEVLDEICSRIERIGRVLNGLTRKLLVVEQR
jgi:hypothetical protein